MKTISRWLNFAGWPVQRKITFGLLIAVLFQTLIVITSIYLYSQAVSSDRLVSRFTISLVIILLAGLLLIIIQWTLLNAYVVQPIVRLYQQTLGTDAPSVAPHLGGDELVGLSETLERANVQSRQLLSTLEQRVAQRTRDIEAARDIGQLLSNIRDVEMLLNAVISLIVDRFDQIYHAQVFLLDTQRENAVLRASTGEAGEQLLARGHRLLIGSKSVVGQAASSGAPMIALDTATNPIYRINDLLPATQAECALPLRVNNEVIGVLDLQSMRTDAFSDADIRLFQTVADQLAIALQNARLFEDSQKRLREIEALNKLLTGDTWRDYLGKRRHIAPAIAVLAETNSLVQQQAIDSGALAERFDGDTVYFAVPIILAGQTLGAVEWEIARNNYTDNTRQLAVELAARLALAADNARLFEQSERLARRESLLNSISNQLTQQTEVSQILQIAVKELGRALPVVQTSISLIGDQQL